jgi:hypothetical protein
MRRPNRSQARDHEGKAWDLRCRGWSQWRIAAQIGVCQQAVSKILARVEARELKRLSESVERLKVEQTGQLGHVIEESVDAWHRSKQPRKRATSRTGGGSDDEDGGGGSDTVKTLDVIERDGDPAFLYAAMNAMDRIRSLWGLDVSPALQDPAASVAELARDLLKRSDAYEQRKAQEGQADHPGRDGAADPGGAPPVPAQPESVQ